jgi:hypothetical protein
MTKNNTAEIIATSTKKPKKSSLSHNSNSNNYFSKKQNAKNVSSMKIENNKYSPTKTEEDYNLMVITKLDCELVIF